MLCMENIQYSAESTLLSCVYHLALSLLCELLLNEERSQMRQLPCTSKPQHSQLDKSPPDNLCVCALALVSKLGLSFLFISNVSQAAESSTRYNQPTLWKTCSLLTSCNLAFRSLTLLTMLSIFSLSSLSIALLAPMARSRFNFTPPIIPCPPPLNHPPTLIAAGPEGVKHIRCKPLSAAVNMNLDQFGDEVVVCFTTRSSLSNVSSTVTRIERSLVGLNVWVWVL